MVFLLYQMFLEAKGRRPKAKKAICRDNDI